MCLTGNLFPRFFRESWKHRDTLPVKLPDHCVLTIPWLLQIKLWCVLRFAVPVWIMLLSCNADLLVPGRRWRSGFLLKTLGDSVHGDSITSPVVKQCRYILICQDDGDRRYNPSGYHLVEKYLAMLRQNAMEQVEVRVTALLCTSVPFAPT